MRQRIRNKDFGFTIVELLVVLALVAAIAVVAGINLFGNRNKTDLASATQDIVASLRQAQSNAMSQNQNTAWGVYFNNATNTTPFFALISSSTYQTSTVAGQYPLPKSVLYDTATLASGASTTISFAQVTGFASASKTIRIYIGSQSSLSSTISIASSGAVSY